MSVTKTNSAFSKTDLARSTQELPADHAFFAFVKKILFDKLSM